jgi:CBS domain containing-hemolysin-like protein
MTALLLLAVLALVLLNGFFVAAEFALVRVGRSRIEETRGGPSAARSAPRAARRPSATSPPASSASR